MSWTETTLDGCSGSGGAAHGLAKAGHYVIGVDTRPEVRDDYLRSGAHEFHCASILDVLSDAAFMARITFSWVSPPCQFYSKMLNCRPGLRAAYPDLITPCRPLLDEWGGPYVIENVTGARAWMKAPAVLCMWGHFGRETYRHRLTEAGGGLVLTPPGPPASPSSTGVSLPAGYIRSKSGSRPDRECGWPHPVPAARAGHWKPGYFVSVSGHERKEPVQAVMEASWMRKREDVAESIPWYMAFWAATELAAWRETEAAA